MSTAPAIQPRPMLQACSGRAAVIDAPRSIHFSQLEFSEPRPNEVRVRLQGCGICGSNLPVWEGRPWFDYPREAGAPGHEGWGVVDAVGDDVTSVRVGERVALLSYHAFATHDLADADEVVRLPAALENVPFPGEAVGCAMNVFARSNVWRGETVAVVGVGFLGALLIQLAAAAGARVVAVSRRGFSLEVARRSGATQVISIADTSAVERVMEFNDGAGCDCVIEAVGLQQSLDFASKLVKTRGRLVVAGYHQDGTRVVDMQSWNWRGIDVVNAHEREPSVYVRGIHEAVEAVADGRIRLDGLLTHEFRLDELNRAFRIASERPAGFLKAWVRCD